MYNWVLYYYTVYTQVEAGDGASANNSLSEEDKMRREVEAKNAEIRELNDQITKVEEDMRTAREKEKILEQQSQMLMEKDHINAQMEQEKEV